MKLKTVSNLWRRLERQVSLKRHKPDTAQPPSPPFVPHGWPPITDPFLPLSPKVSLSEAAPSIAFDPPPKPQPDPTHNAELTISSLPPEIFAEIFLLVCEASFLQDSSWIAACSHVCWSWRQIALATPLLWAHVVFTSRAWMNASLERAKCSLLIVGGDIGPGVEALVREVLQKTKRIGRIQLTYTMFGETIWILLAGPFPNPTYLSINSIDPWAVPTVPLQDVPPFPALRSLLLCTCVSYLPPLPSQLVSLEIYCSSWIPVPWDSFSRALDQLQQLQVLKLLGFSAPATVVRQISLPELRDLHLSNTPAKCTAFMEALDCAKLRRFNLHLTSFDEIGNLYRALSGRLPKPPKSMNISRDRGWIPGGNELLFRPFPLNMETASVAFTYAYANERWPRDISLDICLSWIVPDVRADLPLAKIFVALTELGFLEHLEWLMINDWNTIPQVLWRPLLRRLAGLQTLAANGSPPAGLFWDLVRQLESGGDGDAALLPSLRTIKIINVNCSAGNWLPQLVRVRRPADPDALPINSHFDLDNTRFLELLICYLELRCTPLQRLSCWECFAYTGSEIKLLRRLVEEVVWDGRGMAMGQYSSNGDDAGALTISHALIAGQKGYAEMNVSEEEWWRENAMIYWDVRPSTRMSDRLYDGDPETEK